MASRAQKIKVGAFVLGGLGLLALGLALLGTYGLWRDRATYYAVYDGTVAGLESGALVHVRGVRSGEVGDIELDPRGETTRVRVTLELDADAPVREGSYAQLSRMGVSSLMYIDILGGTPGGELLEPGAVLPGKQPVLERAADRAIALLARSEQLIEQGEQLLSNVNALTDAQMRQRVENILGGAEQLVASLRRTSNRVGAAAAETDQLMAEARVAIDEVGESATETLADLDRAIADAQTLIGAGQSTLRQNLPKIHTTLENLRTASQSIKELAWTLRNRPSRLLFSRAPKERKLP